MKFVWMASAGGGAIPPQLALCEALVNAGHEVIAVVSRTLQERAERVGVRVEAFDYAPAPSGLSEEAFERWLLEDTFLGATYSAALRDAIRRHEPDRVLVDGMSYSGLVEAKAAGIPHAALWHCLVDLAERRSNLEFLDEPKNLVAHNAHRRAQGLDAVSSVQDNLLEATWFLAFAYEALDSPRQRVWPNLHYVGAAMPSQPPSGFEVPAGGTPLVIVGFSTTTIDQTAVLQRVFDAVELLDVRVVANLAPETAVQLAIPDNVTTVEFVPHDEVLPHAALMVSHAGHGSMSAAARHGVPMLALPMGADMDRNAELLAESGLGRWLPSTSEPAEIARSVVELLGDEAIRRHCRQTAGEISGQERLAHAVVLLTAETRT